MKQSNTLQKIQYLNYITGIPVLYKILKKNHNTGTNLYTSIVHNTSIPVLRSPSTGDSTYGSSARSDSHRAVFCPNSVCKWLEKLTGVQDKYI